jgi:hypothetical protein
MLNSILIRRRRSVHLMAGCNDLPASLVGTILHNLATYGYTLHPDVVYRLRTLAEADAEQFHAEVISAVRELVGANQTYQPMYPNFPKQVMEASEAELYINAIMHYLGDWLGIRILPDYKIEERPPLFEETEPVVLGLMEEEDIHKMFSNLMASRTSISQTDQADLRWYVGEYAGNLQLPSEIHNKEVLAFLTGLVGLEPLASCFKTATDLLRVAVSLSDGDVSLATRTKFRSFRRAERRFFLRRLNELKNPVSDMARHRGAWIRLGERLHPGEFRKRYPSAFQAFQRMRDGKTIETDRSRVEESLALGDVPAALLELRRSPGDLARRLDHLLRLDREHHAQVLEQFVAGLDKISTPVLLQVASHFEYRPDPDRLRAVFPKGQVAKLKALPSNGVPLPAEVCHQVVQHCQDALISRFSELPKLGKVYLDTALSGYTVPFSQRSASRALRTVSRGSRVHFGDKNTLRFFIWWRDLEEPGDYYKTRVDVDLSVVFYDADWKYLSHVSYTQLKGAGVYHSGDITSAPEGACEFIDMNLAKVRDRGVRYALPSVLSYSRQKFTDMPECYFGWMSRARPNSGEIFEPRTVEQRVDLSTDLRICIPAVFDLQARDLLWADIALRSDKCFANNIESNEQSLALMGKALTEMRKPNLWFLFMCHVMARAEKLVDSPEEADLVFSPTEGVTPYDIDQIMGEWLV